MLYQLTLKIKSMKNIILIVALSACASSVMAQSTEKNAPVVQVIPAGTVLKASVASQAPVAAPAVKSVAATNVASGTLFPVTGLTLATATTAEQVTTAPAVITQQTIGTAKPAQTPVEIPASVINPAPKSPAASTEKTKGKN